MTQVGPLDAAPVLARSRRSAGSAPAGSINPAVVAALTELVDPAQVVPSG